MAENGAGRASWNTSVARGWFVIGFNAGSRKELADAQLATLGQLGTTIAGVGSGTAPGQIGDTEGTYSLDRAAGAAGHLCQQPVLSN